MCVDLNLMQIEENRRRLKTTVLYRQNGNWHPLEVGLLTTNLDTEVSCHPKYPEYLILFGHYTKQQTLGALRGCQAYIATQVTGMESDKLPFNPGFI